MEDRIILFDVVEKDIKHKQGTWGIPIFILLITIDIFFLKIDNSIIYFLLGLFFFGSWFRLYLVCRKIKCPYCFQRYFIPAFYSRSEIKKIIKSNPPCINCHQCAKIESEYHILY